LPQKSPFKIFFKSLKGLLCLKLRIAVEYTPKLTKIKELLKSDDRKAIDWAFLSESHEYSLIIR